MKHIPFQSGEYVASALDSSSFPVLRSLHGALLPEIAIVGRSNVGKSSLINHLLNLRGLAHVSSTPGKTRMINFFAIDQMVGLIDLPGYGYAKVPKQMRETWAKGLDHYLKHRESLQLILLLLDIRRVPSEEDLFMAAWCAHQKKPFIIVFTKSDKLTPFEQQSSCQNSLKFLEQIPALKLHAHVIYSIKEKQGRDALIIAINELFRTL